MAAASALAAASIVRPERFTFDRVFAPDVQQQEVYEAIGVPVLQSVLMGFNGCILAYGQTASGKTYTVEGSLSASQMQSLAKGGVEVLFGGPPATPGGGGGGGGSVDATVAAQAGLIPRLVRGLFEAVAQADSHTSFTMSCQLIEIYQEGLRDLLHKGIAAQSRRISRGGGARESLGQSGFLPDGSVTARALGSSQLLGGVTEEEDAVSVDDGGAGADFDDTDSLSGAPGMTPAPAAAATATVAATDDEDDTARLLRSAVSSGKLSGRETPNDSGQLQIREDPERGVFVAGAAQLPVTSSRHVFEALALGSAHRATASTKMNERSSRSHSVFQLYITQVRSVATLRGVGQFLHDSRIFSS
jgi:hypothetical protein